MADLHLMEAAAQLGGDYYVFYQFVASVRGRPITGDRPKSMALSSCHIHNSNSKPNCRSKQRVISSFKNEDLHSRNMSNLSTVVPGKKLVAIGA